MTDDSLSTGATARRMRRITMLTAVLAIAPLCLIGVVLTAESWWEGLIVLAGLLLTIGIVKEWSLDGYPVRAVVAFAFTAAAWALSSVTASGPLGFVPVSLIGALLLARLGGRRLLVSILFAFAVALIGSIALIPRAATWALTDSYVLLPLAGTLFIAGVVTVSERSWQLVRRLERARDAETELAIAHERMRFAGDLHDIQGHTLHVIKLKAALAQSAVRVDPGRATDELGEIRRLVDEAILKTRELAYARHELDLMVEVENARRLCEAAGMTVDVEIDDRVREAVGAVDPLLAHVLREATTNLLRHAHPTRVSITAAPGHVEIANDGAEGGDEVELRGLARLRERIELAGGDLRVVKSRGGFRISARLGDREERGAAKGRALSAPGMSAP